ncbi:MAG TPA: cbb3-type cytochrome c oxidase subunit I [Bacteroidia bacterium]
MKKEIGIVFIALGLAALLGGLFFGSIAALQFVFPGFLHDFSYVRTRPLHVSLVVSWIFLSATGGIYYYLPKYCEVKLYSDKLPRIHFWLFLITGILILACYFLGLFGGREYWEYPVYLSIPIFVSWFLFGFNFFKSLVRRIGKWPVHLWMWATGIVFFFFTFSEAHLWLFPYFRDNLVRDLTVQWKAYGALFGSWNMLVYGTAMFVMVRIKGDETIAHSRLAFLMYALGFANLLFGWAHHIYIVPSALWIRLLSYFMSMTELLILSKIIWNWKQSLTEAKRNFHVLPFRFLVGADIWVLLNLALAILISIPAVNIFTHGTHITVAHAMGSTIGINTMILLASCFFLISDITQADYSPSQKKQIKLGFWLLNIFLTIFWLCLIFAGAEKGMMVVENKLNFQEIMMKINPLLMVFAFSGIGIFIGLLMVVIPPLRSVISYLKK